MGTVIDGAVKLNEIGCLIEASWRDLPNHHCGLRLDDWVVMPDHLHGILILPHGMAAPRTKVGAQQAAPLQKSRVGAVLRAGIGIGWSHSWGLSRFAARMRH